MKFLSLPFPSLPPSLENSSYLHYLTPYILFLSLIFATCIKTVYLTVSNMEKIPTQKQLVVMKFDEKHKKLHPSLFTPVLINFVFETVCKELALCGQAACSTCQPPDCQTSAYLTPFYS